MLEACGVRDEDVAGKEGDGDLEGSFEREGTGRKLHGTKMGRQGKEEMKER